MLRSLCEISYFSETSHPSLKMLDDVYNMQTKLTICLIVFFSECKKEVDIVIVLDGSNSIFPWPHIRGFLHRFIEKIEIGPKLSQVSCFL